ncbi:MAG: hypothetical protein DSY57_02505 [Desulfobulbus sp.]|nr:MAG: hypothetical protein DSY57_02505 [Desulfobulbus sp.]
MRSLLLVLSMLLLLGGCSSKEPVKHLAAEAAMIQPGVTTKTALLATLGQPNGRRTVSPGVEEYVYYADRKGMFSGMPVVGSWLGNKGYEMIIVTLHGNLVTDCQFRTFSESDQDWVHDFSWEDVR